MKKVLALFLLVAAAWAFTKTDVDIIDEGITNLSAPHHVLPTSRQGTYLVDSSGNVFTSWTQRQECLSYNPTLDGLEFVCRGYSPTGVLNVSQSDGSFTFWVTDLAVYNQEIGPNQGARYPSSLASSNGPHIGYPVLPGWGNMAGNYESGGWYSSFWDPPVDFGDEEAPRCVPKELPNGDIVFFADITTAFVRYETYSPDLLTLRAEGNFPLDSVDYIGADVNNGTCYCFMMDIRTFEIFYSTTTDGVTWTTPVQWNITWPSPYTNNLIDFYQMAVTDAGNPIIAFNIADNDAAAWPYASKTYVQTASGATPIQVSDDTYTCSTWPTIATGGDLVAVLMHVWTNAQPDSFARMDHFAAFSADNGANWTTPVNLTAAEPNKPGLGQLAKRLNATDGKIYFYYGVSLTQPGYDPDYFMYWTGGTGPALEPAAWYMAWDYVTGIEENKTDTPTLTTLNFAPNPATRHATVSYTLSKAGEVSLRIFDLAGREVQTVTSGNMNAGVYSVNVDTGNLANGTYFFVLDSPAGTVSRSLVVVH